MSELPDVRSDAPGVTSSASGRGRRGRPPKQREPEQVAEEPLRDLTDAEREATHSNTKRLRNDPGFIAAVESAKEQIMREICNTKPVEGEVREALYFEQRALNRLQARLDSLGSTHVARNAHRSIA